MSFMVRTGKSSQVSLSLRQLVPAIVGTLVSLPLILPGNVRAADPKGETYTTVEEAKQDPDFALQGEYVTEGSAIQLVAQGDGDFLAVIYKGGLPGKGWDQKTKQVIPAFREDAEALIEGYEKLTRKSPTLDMKPPKRAIVLFDGSQESLEKHWKQGAKKTDDGLLVQGCTTTDTFQDFTLHLEFRTPYMPKARGQARGNSGVYYQARYETQVLDSFGLEGKNNECGGLYSIKDSDLNMCLPPLQWQTYDVDFTAARFDDAGKKTRDAKITVRLNGVVIHNDVSLPNRTTASPLGEGPEPGPIYIQDHGNPVRYRNIWVIPRDSQRYDERPIVPGFERFHANLNSDPVAGGDLLMGELNCVACHQPSDALTARITPKAAPDLNNVGSRIRPEYLLEYIVNPQGVKPGTTMPNIFHGVDEATIRMQATPLVHYLVSTGTLQEKRLDRLAVQRGKTLFHQVGCVACHAPQDGRTVSARTTIPLTGIEKKYTVPGLTQFLEKPHGIRPSGRMPDLMLNNQEAGDIAQYLLRAAQPGLSSPLMTFKAYHGSWEKMPNFAELSPAIEGTAVGFDVTLAERGDLFALVFEGTLDIKTAGEYTFWTASDDGSQLYVNDKLVVNNDGVHGVETKSGKLKLDAGPHPVKVTFFEYQGGEELRVEVQGPDMGRGPVSRLLKPLESKKSEATDSADEPKYVFDPSQVAHGKMMFSLIGCAACHKMKSDGKPAMVMGTSRPLAELNPEMGCLSDSPPPAIPYYSLDDRQLTAIRAALNADAKPVTESDSVVHRMKTFNCYACHERDGLGGPEVSREPLFVTTIPEMGDEGRLPPTLTGVGDKLKESYLEKTLRDGAKDRPYMKARMPGFGTALAKTLRPQLVSLDQVNSESIPQAPDETDLRIIASGRKLVGGEALSCIKCHTYGNIQATGIQAIDMKKMPQRLREDWFHRYMVDPTKYRPGTRMPNSFPNGKSAYPDVYEGEPGQQLAAIWTYLSAGDKGGIPPGLVKNPILLKPTDAPILYRNFIQGLSPRGIAVGYPEKVNLAFDANTLTLRLLWHNDFIDASKHWVGRGPGNQNPAGDHLLTFEREFSFATLEDAASSPWPNLPPKEQGIRFKGYRLNETGQPTFRYAGSDFEIEDHPVPAFEEGEADIDRAFRVMTEQPLVFRAGRGNQIQELEEGWYFVDNSYKVRIQHPELKPQLVKVGNDFELRLELPANTDPVEFVQQIRW